MLTKKLLNTFKALLPQHLTGFGPNRNDFTFFLKNVLGENSKVHQAYKIVIKLFCCVSSIENASIFCSLNSHELSGVRGDVIFVFIFFLIKAHQIPPKYELKRLPRVTEILN